VSRRRRPQPTAPRNGDLIIDARVRARLLRLPLLDIDAQIVVAPARASVLPVAAVHSPSRASSDRESRPEQHRPRAISPDAPAPPELAHAMRLIREGSTLLDEAARVR
jgi:hypothetical protein